MQTFIINTKIYYNNHFIIASWAYLQQSPTCTRVNNLVYICKDITPWPSGAYHVLLMGEVLVNGSDTLRNVCIFAIHLRLHASLIFQMSRH